MSGTDLTLEGEERLRIALDAGHMGTWEWDLRTGGMSWSPGLEEIFGLVPGSFDGTLEALRRLIHPEDREPVVEALREGAEGGREPHLEYRILRPDGSMRWVESWGRLHPGDGGRPRRMIGLCADRTERKRVEEAFRLLAEASSVLSQSLDPHAVLASVARLVVPPLADFCTIDVMERGAVRRVAAHAVEALQEVAQAAMAFPPDLELAAHPIVRALRTGELQRVEAADGSLLNRISRNRRHRELQEAVELRSGLVVPLVARGKTRGAICLVFGASGRAYRAWDVTLAEELARRVALAVDNLYLYHDARLALRARDQVLAVVSHDLRNLVHPIAISAEQLWETLPGEGPVRRSVDLIRRSVDQMDGLIQDLLDVARIEEGRMVLQRERVEAADLISETVESHLALAGQRSIHLAGEIAPATPAVEADHHRLLRVLANLVGNALKFTPAGGRVTVGAEPYKGEVRFWVSDTGPGIPEEDQPHLFAPFWQAAPEARGGTGLGLSIALRIVEAHGGRLWVDSTQGKGSVFSFTLAAAR
ncbi:MAG: PAS domain-containing sensor histidine kinase [Thermoanaerobaculia bacterium]